MIAVLVIDAEAGTFAGAMLPADDGSTSATPLDARLAEHLQPALRYQCARHDAGAIFVHVPEE